MADSVMRPDYYICVGPRVCDYSAIYLEQLELMMGLDIDDRDPDEEVVIICEKKD